MAVEATLVRDGRGVSMPTTRSLLRRASTVMPAAPGLTSTTFGDLLAAPGQHRAPGVGHAGSDRDPGFRPKLTHDGGALGRRVVRGDALGPFPDGGPNDSRLHSRGHGNVGAAASSVRTAARRNDALGVRIREFQDHRAGGGRRNAIADWQARSHDKKPDPGAPRRHMGFPAADLTATAQGQASVKLEPGARAGHDPGFRRNCLTRKQVQDDRDREEGLCMDREASIGEFPPHDHLTTAIRLGCTPRKTDESGALVRRAEGDRSAARLGATPGLPRRTSAAPPRRRRGLLARAPR